MEARGRGCGSWVWLVGVALTNVRPIIPRALAGDVRLG